MIARLLDEARAEMLEAAQYYELCRAGLGEQFLDAIDRAIVDVEQFPRRWPVIAQKVRRRLVGRFPYGVLYRIGRTEIVVVAIMHLSRHPRYWVERVNR